MTPADIEQGEEFIQLLRKIPHPSPWDYYIPRHANAKALANEVDDWIERQSVGVENDDTEIQ
ncbi:MAG: hypothetical protein ABIN18_20040 [Pseudomonadota bacterium]